MRVNALAVLSTTLLIACGVDDGDEHDLAEMAEGYGEAWEESALGKADSWACSGVVPPDLGPFDRRIALTFDDGPNPATTPQVLDVLEAHGAHATFFINGKNVTTQEVRDLVADMIRRGHIVANHTQNHINARTLPLATFVGEVEQTDRLIEEVTGMATPFMRYPYGAATCTLNTKVRELGYTVVGWHIDSADWCFAAGRGECKPATWRHMPAEHRGDMLGWVMTQARAKQGGVVLFHDIHANTADSLDGVLTALEAEGFGFTTIDDAVRFPLLNGVPPPRQSFVGDTCASDADCGFEREAARGYCATFTDDAGAARGFCSLACEGYCPDLSGRAPTFCADALSGTGGMCVSKASAANLRCATIPGTAPARASRFVGTSAAPPAEAEVCLP